MKSICRHWILVLVTKSNALGIESHHTLHTPNPFQNVSFLLVTKYLVATGELVATGDLPAVVPASAGVKIEIMDLSDSTMSCVLDNDSDKGMPGMIDVV